MSSSELVCRVPFGIPSRSSSLLGRQLFSSITNLNTAASSIRRLPTLKPLKQWCRKAGPRVQSSKRLYIWLLCTPNQQNIPLKEASLRTTCHNVRLLSVKLECTQTIKSNLKTTCYCQQMQISNVSLHTLILLFFMLGKNHCTTSVVFIPPVNSNMTRNKQWELVAILI